ncbi:MAG: hypothetical protein Q7S15_00890 [bacterium]|nr:hypothetical protein [bacterium]
MPNDLGTIENSRTPDQYRHMLATIGKGICPFCSLVLCKGEVLREGLFWRIWHNPFPYEHHAYHFVVAHKEHKTDILDLTAGEWAELGEFNQWAIRKFKLPGGGLVMRFGDPAFNAGTIRHLHAHIQNPDLRGPAKATFAKDICPRDIEQAIRESYDEMLG